MVGIIGYGEIGKAVAKFYKKPKIKDLKRDDGLQGVDVLNICIPFSDEFTDIVAKEIKQIKPKLTIIHSTVVPGTTAKIKRLTKASVVHSPVRGIHPYLYEGIKAFIKYIGADTEKDAKLAEKHFKELGIKTKTLRSVDTEVGKLLDTTYYGVCIAWHGEMAKICEHYGADFNGSVTDFNMSYNEGYTKLGKENVVRPTLYKPDKIGGHCVIPNAKLLRRQIYSKAIEMILDYE